VRGQFQLLNWSWPRPLWMWDIVNIVFSNAFISSNQTGCVHVCPTVNINFCVQHLLHPLV
jgi:hypothetical protein